MAKVRSGFVSNSSSSSFICLVCGEEASGWDLSLSDAEMVECKNGHVFCGSHLLEKEKEKSTTNAIDDDEDLEENDEDEDYDDDDEYEVEIERCPICQFRALATEDGFAYLLQKANLTNKQCLAQIKQEFRNYDEFRKFFLGVKK